MCDTFLSQIVPHTVVLQTDEKHVGFPTSKSFLCQLDQRFSRTKTMNYKLHLTLDAWPPFLIPSGHFCMKTLIMFQCYSVLKIKILSSLR